MKIDQPKNLELNTIGEEMQSQQASIAQDSMPFLFEMLSRNLYSNPIGSIVREITSNCFDAHQEAHVEDAVVISKGEDDEGVYIAFKDVGIGMSPDRIKTVYMNYFSSTKRETNEQIGGFGLGSKTPLAYADYFYITTIHEGFKYYYILSRGEKAPTLDLLEDEMTTERNGTEIKIYIKTTQDESLFRAELKAQLCYFDNVYFHNWGIDNHYKIYETDTFKYRSKDRFSEEMHIVLGKVCYPINWKELKSNAISIPVGVKFEIGELLVTPNREALRYTDEIKELVSRKVQLAFNECLKMYNEQNEAKTNYFEWFALRKTKPFITFSYKETDANGEEGEVVDKLYLTGVKEVDKKHRLDFIEDMEFFKEDNLLQKLYGHVASFENGVLCKEKRRRRGYYHSSLYPVSFDLTPDSVRRIFITKGHTCTEGFAYLKQNGATFREIPLVKRHNISSMEYPLIKRYENHNRFFTKVSEMSIYKLEKHNKKVLIEGNVEHLNRDRDRDNLDLSNTDRGTTKFGNGYTYFNLGIGIKFYKALKTLRQQVLEKWEAYRELNKEELSVFKKWKDQNNLALQRRLQGKVLCKNMATAYAGDTFEWTVKDQRGEKGTFVEHGIASYTGIVIYGFQKDVPRLKKAVTFIGQFRSDWRTLSPSHKNLSKKGGFTQLKSRHAEALRKQAVRIIQISQQNEKFFKGKENMIHVDKLYSDNKLFRQLASSLKVEDYLAHTVRNMNYGVEDYIRKINNLSTEIGGMYDFLHRYYKRNSNDKIAGAELVRSDIKKEIIEIAEKHNLFDPDVEMVLRNIDEWFKGIEWLKFVELNEESFPIVLKELRERKKKLNIEYYQKVVVEDKYTIKGVDRKQLSLELVIQEEHEPKFRILTPKAA